MNPSNDEQLKELHEKITDLRRNYVPPLRLMSKVDAEYTEYMHGREGFGYYPWLALAVRLLRPKRILELGSYRGSSAIMMYSEFTPETEWLVSADVTRDLRYVPDEMMNDARVRFITGNDLDLNIYQGRLPEPCDFLFLDTLHELQHLEDEWSIYRHLCEPGALVVLDDIRTCDMYPFWERCPFPKLEIAHAGHPSGFGIFCYLPQNGPSPALSSGSSAAYQAALSVACRRLNEAEERRRLESLSETPKTSCPCRAAVRRVFSKAASFFRRKDVGMK